MRNLYVDRLIILGFKSLILFDMLLRLVFLFGYRYLKDSFLLCCVICVFLG